MKAITVKRQYADRIASGAKRYEVRNFRPSYRGPVVVTVSGEKIAIAVVDLVDVVPSAEVLSLTPEERAYGKWAWVLDNARKVQPAPCRGKLGLWNWTGQPLYTEQGEARMKFNIGDRVRIATGFYQWSQENNPGSASDPTNDGTTGTIEGIHVSEGLTWYTIRVDMFWTVPTPEQFVEAADSLSAFEREFLAVLVDSPLDAAFARHLKPDSAAAFERFKTMGFVELAAISDRWRITNAGRRALSLPRDPQSD